MSLMAVSVMLGVTGCDSGGIVNINEATEIDIGRQAASDIERQYGVVNDPVQTPRVQRIGRSIAAVSGRPNLPWTFRILNINEVNAISLPGGPIYVTRGLLAQNISDNELAGVLGHEIAHTQERHAVNAIERAMTYQLLSELVLGDAGAVRVAADLAVQYALELPRSREAEYESDSLGIRLAYNAGYPANGMVLFLQRLQALTGTGRTPEWMRTHPLTADRIARAQQIAGQVQGQARPVPVALFEDGEKSFKDATETEKVAK
ncbi:MAG: M48 family metallopeptidase [Armatimonadota bacterium]